MAGFLQKIMGKKDKQQVHTRNTDDLKQITLSKDIYNNIGRLMDIMNHSFDIKVRDFKIGLSNKPAAIVYIDNLAQEDMILDHILKPLMYESTSLLEQTGEVDFQKIKDCLVTIGSVETVKTFDRVVLGIMSGDTFLSVQGYKEGLMINVREYHGKQFSAPLKEPSVKGPQEAFIETLKQNIGLIRKRLRDPNLVFEVYRIGRRTKQDAVLAYIKDIANQDIVDEVRKRIRSIDIDGLISATQIGLLGHYSVRGSSQRRHRGNIGFFSAGSRNAAQGEAIYQPWGSQKNSGCHTQN